MSRQFKVIKFHKLYIVQIYGYLALIPFYFSFQALRINYQLVDLIFFAAGLLFLSVLLLVNHLEPVVRVTKDKIILYNKFHNRATMLLKDNYISYKTVNSRMIIVTFINGKYEIKLNVKDIKKLKSILEEIN